VTRFIIGHLFTTKTLIRAAFTALSLSSIGVAHSQTNYRTPAHNYAQNNWMSHR
jgi:hypothetical protein